MRLSLVTFDYRGTDLEAEDRSYYDTHVRLARGLAGLALYATGRLRAIRGVLPDRYRAALIGFDDAAFGAMPGETGDALRADTRARMRELHSDSADVEAVIPFAGRAGDPCFVLAATFDLSPELGSDAEADRRYRAEHVERTRQLPGVRGYYVGRLVQVGRAAPDRQRLGVLVFDEIAAAKAAYASTLGKAVIHETALHSGRARFYHLDATVER